VERSPGIGFALPAVPEINRRRLTIHELIEPQFENYPAGINSSVRIAQILKLVINKSWYDQ
jgi:hypothetical protein